ncbi:histidinol-phosphate transaminase [Brevibacterium casei]|uniref:histidinol-phosphate transaminase n=1 Tax=Brevibacterium casei TaxID=33889 RepID=UPI0021AFB555|nr:histidinol-phosphate transaminase [Brevibacterium casei]MCT2359443.1 histidinol-phosphate transaminase [Brevibacterium casei]
MSKRFLLRDALTQFPPYKPGKPPSDAPGLAPYKLSSNENHFAPLPGITEAVAAATQVPAAYPDPKSAKLVAEIAAYLDVDPSEVVPGAGASEILSALTNITLEAGTSVVYPWPSFEMYPILASARGAEKRAVPLLPDGRHDFAGMLAEIDDTTRLVLLCSPNNPTGPSVRTSELDGFMAEVPAGVIVALDEAYWEFATDAEAVDGLAAFRKYDNLVLARTFSKAHGLAGLRVGYGVADAEIATALRQVVAPFSVTTGAQAAASESLARVGEVLVRAKEVAATRDRFAADLRDLGFDVPDAQGNYVWIALDDEAAAAFEDACAAQAVAIRRLSCGVRVSIGADEALDRVRAVAREFAAR